MSDTITEVVAAQATAATIWQHYEPMVEGRLFALLGRRNGDRLEVVAERPALLTDAAGRPRFSLTLMLGRRPDVGEVSLEPLITGAVLGLTAALATPGAVLEELGRSEGRVLPLFARRARLSLRLGDSTLRTSEAIGIDVTAAFSLTLDRAGALEALAALHGTGQLSVACEIDHVAEQPPCELSIVANQARLYDSLALGGTGPFPRTLFEERVARAIEDHTLMISSMPVAVTLSVIVDALSRVAPNMIRRVTTEEAETFELRARPHQAMSLDVMLRNSGQGGIETLHLEAPLGAMLEGLDPVESDLYLHLVVPGPNGVWEALPARQEQLPARGSRAPTRLGEASLARAGGMTLAVSALARPSLAATPQAHVLLAAEARPQVSTVGHPHQWVLDDTMIAGPRIDTDLSLPLVENADAPLWPDKVTAGLNWYAPSFSLVMPEPNATTEASPFLFLFKTSGHGMSGTTGLDGTIRFRLRPGMSEATTAAGQPDARPVPTEQVSVMLDVPFRDQSGATRSQGFAADITEEGGDLIATVRLIDDWVRLAYGALAIENFQSQPAGLRVAYVFRAYVPVDETRLTMLFDRKVATIPLLGKPAPSREISRAFLDTRAVAFRAAGLSLRFDPERPSKQPPATRALRSDRIADLRADQLQVKRPISDEALTPFPIRPRLDAVAIDDIVAQRRFALQTQGRESVLPALLPCGMFGAFYVEQDATGQRAAVGCRDALSMGQTTYRQYERIEALTTADYAVWRSLQQPGRFLLVPARFAIARFVAEDPERAYRPSIFLYSTVDAEDAGNNRCVALASLIPDLRPTQRQTIARALADLAADPVLLAITEIEADVTYAWPVPEGFEVKASRLFDCFQVSIGCALGFAPQLQAMLRNSGLIGSASFALPDGSRIATSLAIDLRRIVGPEPGGPLAATVSGGNCRLINMIEQPVDVADLAVARADGTIEIRRVDQRILAGATLDVVVPADTTGVTVNAEGTGGAATLTELRSFIEDVHTNVAFVNLIHFANHALASLRIEARIRGVEGDQSLDIEEATPIKALDFILPLTVFLAEQILEFSATRVMDDGAVIVGAAHVIDLAAQGNVISLTWDSIQ